jgi:hypothetical protein
MSELGWYYIFWSIVCLNKWLTCETDKLGISSWCFDWTFAPNYKLRFESNLDLKLRTTMRKTGNRKGKRKIEPCLAKISPRPRNTPVGPNQTSRTPALTCGPPPSTSRVVRMRYSMPMTGGPHRPVLQSTRHPSLLHSSTGLALTVRRGHSLPGGSLWPDYGSLRARTWVVTDV